MKTKLFLTGFAIVAFVFTSSAQNPVSGKGNGTCKGTAKGAAFVDANNNGVCDTYESRSAKGTLRNGKGNGNCDGTGKGKGLGQGQGKGKNFVDANQNGICDTHEEKTNK